MTGLVIDESGFEVLAGDYRIGGRRSITEADVTLLNELAARYVTAVQTGAGAGVFTKLGRELFAWLDGDEAQLSSLLNDAPRPLVFEVRGPRSPSEAAWAVLRAPFELLARPDGGFLAEEALTRFCVARRLGTPAAGPALDGFRLGLAFMASAPGDQHELDFEAEEAAILRAVGETRMDLVVDDTGDPEQLAHRLAGLGGMPVVHLSCHGLNNWRAGAGADGVPVLWMENELGAGRPTKAGELVSLLPDGVRLLFVSACLTATGPDAKGLLPPGVTHKGGVSSGRNGLVAHSLATALVSAGIPAVIGWDGSVIDHAATAFAGHLYRALADRVGLAEAVGDARRALMTSDEPFVKANWHMARLWLGPSGGGPVVAGTRKRSLVRATRGTKMFLDRKQQVPVASTDMFVGRRPELQQALRGLRSGDHAGVLLHGQGRLGKSSLAARIADRCPDYAVAVVFGDYAAMAILDAVAGAVRTNEAATKLIEARRAEVRDRPETIGALLVALLAGPCAQAGDEGARPLLLIIDDLEQILVANRAGPHQVDPAHAGVLAAVLSAFDPAETDSRLLLTSRFTFALGRLDSRLAPVQLRPMSSVAQAKLHRRQQALTDPSRVAERSDLADRALAVSRGNPGLQDLIGLRLVYGEQVALDRAEAAVVGMEDYLRQGDLPADADVRVFLENLALDALVEEAGPAQVELLRALTLFDVPIPDQVVAVLAEKTDGSAARICGLGLAEKYQDPHDLTRGALAVDPLAAGRLAALSPSERTAFAAATVRPLFTAWGGAAREHRRAPILDLQLTGLALLSDTPVIVASCAAEAVTYLRDGPAARAFQLGQDTIELLDRHRQPIPLGLLRQAADAALTSGDGQTGEALLNRAVQQAQSDGTGPASALDQGRIIAELATYLVTRGDLEQAERLYQTACSMFVDAGSDGEAAAVMGSIADIAYRQGKSEEALRIFREVALPAFERLGDARDIAVTWAKIADIAFERGELAEGLRIFREVALPVFERLGDAGPVAVTWAKIGAIALERGEWGEALRIFLEVALPAFERLGDARSVAVVWGKVADIAFRRGDDEDALRIFRDVELPAYERLGDARSVAMTWGKIADVAFRREEYEEALRIRREVELQAYERLGDARSLAVTWGKIADVAYEREEYEEARRIRRDVVLPAFEELGHLDGIAATTWGLAQIELVLEDHESAFPLLVKSLQDFIRLQRPDGIAAVGWELGQFLVAIGHPQAADVLGVTLAAAEKIGDVDLAGQVKALLNARRG